MASALTFNKGTVLDEERTPEEAGPPNRKRFAGPLCSQLLVGLFQESVT
jgi:hypothetical protein